MSEEMPHGPLKILIGDGPQRQEYDTGLVAGLWTNPQTGVQEVILPFGDILTAEDCLRIIHQSIKRRAGIVHVSPN